MENIYSDEEILLLDRPKEQEKSLVDLDSSSRLSTSPLPKGFSSHVFISKERPADIREFRPHLPGTYILFGRVIHEDMFYSRILYNMFNIILSTSRLSTSPLPKGFSSQICLCVTYDEKIGYMWDGKTIFYEERECTIAEFQKAFGAGIFIENII